MDNQAQDLLTDVFVQAIFERMKENGYIKMMINRAIKELNISEEEACELILYTYLKQI